MRAKRLAILLLMPILLTTFGCAGDFGAEDLPVVEPFASSAPVSQSGAETEPSLEATVAPTVEPESIFPLIWKNAGWDITVDVMSADLFGVGKEDVLRFLGDENISMVSNFYVNEASVALEFTVPETVAVCDFDKDDGCVDILVCGDAWSSDYITYQLRYDGSGLEIISTHYAWLETVDKEGEIIITEEVNILGTWRATRDYTVLNGVLTPATEVLTNTQNIESARVLTLVKALPVTGSDGRQTELPAGTRLIPAFFVEWDYVDIVTEDGGEYRIMLEYDEEEWEVRIDGIREEEYFEKLTYAG
ncbi:MAG: hypothetical protein Q4C04_04155 [Clostridia bacterium]|nr:hypothetical protein [Clostridia bacterium]